MNKLHIGKGLIKVDVTIFLIMFSTGTECSLYASLCSRDDVASMHPLIWMAKESDISIK